MMPLPIRRSAVRDGRSARRIVCSGFVAVAASLWGCTAESPEGADAETEAPAVGVIANPAAPPRIEVPGWSLDVAEVAFEADVDGNLELFLGRGRGDSTWVRLTSSPGIDRHARWAPQGTWIAFESERNAGAGSREFDIWGLGVNGTDGQTQVPWSGPVPIAVSPAADDDPAISPDGLLVAFHSTRSVASVPDGTAGHLWVADIPGADGFPGAVGRVTRDPIPVAGGTAWHPVGEDLFISRGRGGGGPRDILMISADGTRERTIISDGAGNRDPSPSPDGGFLAYTSEGPDTTHVIVARIDGTGRRRVATGPYRVTGWTPDQAWIVADRIGDMRTEVYLLPLSGSGDAEPFFATERPTAGATFRPPAVAEDVEPTDSLAGTLPPNTTAGGSGTDEPEPARR